MQTKSACSLGGKTIPLCDARIPLETEFTMRFLGHGFSKLF
ncbi:hypothetical protein LEP1GSC079_4565 [Leptospira interrogans str. FPW1039]|uniref:Uncharacterized protein n=1 Tax=Leptospira interrogans str. FPW1039 TaxID=1193040 RepID=A0A0F6IKP2_LEPIR|nr:hypothetical protein LEP1GSC045_3132 [Leptospira interrogans serovar Pomona str. Kennewicki LC82-25]EKN98799.1 hypothetical protein LEP1GSC014_2718 [Leptospira interrogans serovar Pomona str. Pomona]EKO71113.1 hypothetical protein LEP1GSC069_0243 [Leptospira interrogans serovar Canicola str. Fiocruz LV133]EKR33853.1 hypothetical protein LEP1GSC096_0116 [Leptospira interrogans serovar Hebdomadis str. R499]EKR84903.1 hypothetical protein LEP1GSC099_1359 [Leptospira interrogans str. UI 08452]E